MVSLQTTQTLEISHVSHSNGIALGNLRYKGSTTENRSQFLLGCRLESFDGVGVKPKRLR